MALSASVTVNAKGNSDSTLSVDTSEAIGSVDSDGYVLVSEEKYMDGDFFIIDRLYEYPGISTYATDTGTKDLKKSRSIYKNFSNYGDLLAVMWVSGTFKWDKPKDTATVSNPKGWFEDYSDSNYTITNKDGFPEYGSNQGMTTFLSQRYAYIKYIINVHNKTNQSNNEFTLWVDVNIEGNETVRDW